MIEACLDETYCRWTVHFRGAFPVLAPREPSSVAVLVERRLLSIRDDDLPPSEELIMGHRQRLLRFLGHRQVVSKGTFLTWPAEFK